MNYSYNLYECDKKERYCTGELIMQSFMLSETWKLHKYFLNLTYKFIIWKDKITMLKKIFYSKVISNILKKILTFFYKKEYLEGKYFDEKRMGFWWCIRSIPHIIGMHRQKVYWPINPQTSILGGDKIKFDQSSLNVFQNSGCYFQGFEEIKIGKNVWIAQNVGIITANHDLKNPDLHTSGKPVHIGDKCWIGMNAVILPGVVLGENVVVGAGSVVTKSFESGHCVIAGNPAKFIKEI